MKKPSSFPNGFYHLVRLPALKPAQSVYVFGNLLACLAASLCKSLSRLQLREAPFEARAKSA